MKDASDLADQIRKGESYYYDPMAHISNKKSLEMCRFLHKKCYYIRKKTIFAPRKCFKMSNSRTINIKNPSRKLEEHIRKIGVQKYLWIEKLCSDETEPTKTIYV